MDHGTQHKLVLIVAPDGAGKAKLIQQWVQNWPESSLFPPLCLFIDVENNQPIQFLSKLISILTIWDSIFEDCVDLQNVDEQQFLDNGSSEQCSISDMPQKIETLLDAIINKLMDLTGDRFLIMLNYHHIENPRIHSMVAYLIDYLPSNLHLVITSQVTPPLQIPRLRARRELLEIGPDEVMR
jgi:LuxR family maltose regulon positive regulatory protein